MSDVESISFLNSKLLIIRDLHGVSLLTGVPKRNGNRHAIEIADLSLEMMTAANNFRVFFDRDITIKLRVGINTGESRWNRLKSITSINTSVFNSS